MMDEGKILELLAEYLRKTDRILDKLDSHDVLFDKQFKRLDVAYQVIVAHSERFDVVREEIRVLQQQTQVLQEQTQVLQQKSLKQDARTEALWKQLITISKKARKKK